MSSSRTAGKRPTLWARSERSMSSRPITTATESLGNPVAAEGSSTFPARPARARLDVRGTTWVGQRSTSDTSSAETTTHGRRLSNSIQ